MKHAVIIPARYASTRYPGKPLVELRDKNGNAKTLIERTWDCALRFTDEKNVFVATDDDRISDCVKKFGGQVIMTDPECENGTARCAQAYERLPEPAQIVINLQGDAPLTPHWFLNDLAEAMDKRPDVDVATPVLRCDAQTLSHFKTDRENGKVGGTTAVFSSNNTALYFSKEVIPYMPDGEKVEPIPVFHHVGVYAYRPAALRRYVRHKPGVLENLEGLEQLRFLENNDQVLCVEVDAKGALFWELNNPGDVARIQEVL